MVNRKNVNVLKKDLHDKFNINVIPKNYIKQVKIGSNKYEYGIVDKTDKVNFDFNDYDSSQYPATNPNKNTQPIQLSGDDPAVYATGFNPLYPYPPLFYDEYDLYYNVSVVLDLKDFCFPKTSLASVFNYIVVNLNYTENEKTFVYDIKSGGGGSYVYNNKLENDRSVSRTIQKKLTSTKASSSSPGYDKLDIWCQSYSLVEDKIYLKLFIQWNVAKYTILAEDPGYMPTRARLTTLTLDSLDVHLMGDGYIVSNYNYIFGSENNKYSFDIENKLLNNLTVFNNLLLEDQNPYSSKIFDNYQDGKIYGETYTNYTKFKDKNGDIILNGISGKILEPYDIINFPQYDIISNKKFVITGIEFTNKNNEIKLQFKEFIGSDSFSQTADFKVLYIRPNMMSLPKNTDLYVYSVPAYSQNEKQIKDVELKIDPDPLDLVEGDYFFRGPDTSAEGDLGLYTYRIETEERLNNVLMYNGYFWETFEQDGYIMEQFPNTNLIDLRNFNLIYKIEAEGDFELYKCHIKKSKNDIEEGTLQDGDCVVIIK